MIGFLSKLFRSDPTSGSPAIDMFLSGASIPQCAAAQGFAGDAMISGQRQVEAEIRAVVLDLIRENEQLRSELDDCR